MARVLVTLAAVALAAANSRGIGVPCDVNFPNLGSTDTSKKDPSIAMWWTLKPTWAKGKYTLRTADVAGTDPTTYVAGQWTTLYLRATEKHKQHAGLIMYAENMDGVKVGSWSVPPKSGYHQPGACVTHAHANPKSYLSTFKFLAPAGTGPVTIKALVKYGLANPVKGNFYWPGNNAHLTLNEAAAPAQPRTWFQGDVGKSCTEVCSAVGGTCNLETMASFNSASFALVKDTTTCTLPLMAGCSSSSPATTEGGCYFHDATCVIPAPPVIPTRTCSAVCGVWPKPVGYCCTWKDIYKEGTPKSGCYCIDQGAQVDNGVMVTYSEYNGVWSLGTQPGQTSAPTPAPPVAQTLSCDSKITWNSNGHRLCACSGVTTAPPIMPPNNTGGGGTEDGDGNLPGTIPPTSIPDGGNGYRGIPACIILHTPCVGTGGDGPLDEDCCTDDKESVWGCRGCDCKTANRSVNEDVLVTKACESGFYELCCVTDDGKSIWGCRGCDCTKGNRSVDENFVLTKACETGFYTSTDDASGSSRRSGAGFALLLSAAFAFCFSAPLHLGTSTSMGGTRFGVMMVLVLCFLPASQAHNWMTSPARGNEAGENNGFNGFTSPPGPQKSSRIHVQAGVGEKFPIEWSAGHGFGSFTYFAVIKGKDEAKLAEHTFELFDDYLAKAPSTDYLKEYPVHHVAKTPHTHALLQSTNIAADYVWNPQDAAISKGKRPEVFRNFGTPSVYAKTAAGTAADKRAKYQSEKYPWLISVHKFTMQYDFPDDADTTMIEIPAGSEPGKYIVHYMWSGFFDMVDVNVLPEKSTDFFGNGVAGGGIGFDRIDHCEYIPDYPGYKMTSACIGISKTDRIDKCDDPKNDDGRTGIQVLQVPLNSRVSDIKLFSGTSHLPATCATASAGKDRVCFGVVEGTPEVGPTYRISSDPEDPVFYSSCVRRSAGWSFKQVCSTCADAVVDPGFRFGQHCISCSAMRQNSEVGTFIPHWNDAFTEPDKCRDCDYSQGR